MEVFHLGFDEVLWKHDYLNLKLLMLDKLHYVGKGKGKKKPEREMTKEEELKMFQELIEKENRK